MKIVVTQEHIDVGRGWWRDDHCHGLCPVAQAVKEAFDASYVGVGFVTCIYIADGKEWEVKLPHNAKNFILAYDNNKPVQPFEFDL